jgi:hypothetical protein
VLPHVVEGLEKPHGAVSRPATARDPGRSDEREPMNALRPVGCELRRHEPAQRMTHQVDALQPRRLQPAGEPAGEGGGVEPPSQPRKVDEVEAVSVRQRLTHRRPPAPGTGETVHEHDRRPFADEPVADLSPVDLELPELHEASVAAWERHGQVESEADGACAEAPVNLRLAIVTRRP